MHNLIKLLIAFAFIIAITFLAYQIFLLANNPDYAKLLNAKKELEHGNHIIHKKNELLYLKIQALRNDPRTIERKVRDELGLLRHDEVLIILND